MSAILSSVKSGETAMTRPRGATATSIIIIMKLQDVFFIFTIILKLNCIPLDFNAEIF